MITGYKILKAGDYRELRDEQRRKPGTDYQKRFQNERPNEFEFGPIQLVGHVILESDLMIFEYRRPLL